MYFLSKVVSTAVKFNGCLLHLHLASPIVLECDPVLINCGVPQLRLVEHLWLHKHPVQLGHEPSMGGDQDGRTGLRHHDCPLLDLLQEVAHPVLEVNDALASRRPPGQKSSVLHRILHQRLSFDQLQVSLQQVAKTPLLHQLPLLQLNIVVMFKDGKSSVPGPDQMGGHGQVDSGPRQPPAHQPCLLPALVGQLGVEVASLIPLDSTTWQRWVI